MKQIIQDIKNGSTILEEVPAPIVKGGSVVIQTTRSLVSLGTEKMLVEFGKANLIDKARQQPDRVKMVLDKIKAEGLIPTLEAVFNKLGQPLPLGYCNVGKVVEVGKGVLSLSVGDRVVSNGNHAEFVCVPENLTAKIPNNVSDDEAVFTVIGAIGLQGIRLVNPTLGETVVVIGLGLIGLLTAELLKANGCRVIGVDIDNDKIELAKSKSIFVVNPSSGTDSVKTVMEMSGGIGADAVIITASSKSDELIHQAAEMSRKRGRIVLVGVIGLNLRRSDFYEKELTFQVSCSYGPGRYDENYEINGNDYPLGYVRWTEKRNFVAILNSLSQKQIDVMPLISEKVAIEEYEKIYNNLNRKGIIASIITYNNGDKTPERTVRLFNGVFNKGEAVIGIIGAGNFTSSTIVPAIKKLPLRKKYIASAKGLSAKILAVKGDFENATSDYKTILEDPEVNLVMITTRHNLHAKICVEVLQAGKHVFVEKPLALNKEELDSIINSYHSSLKTQNPAPDVFRGSKLTLTVGFNRRFSPYSVRLKKGIGSGQKNIIATMNAGFIPSNVWVQDLETGGGRIIGEACHLIDLCSYFTDSIVISVCMNSMGTNPKENTDNVSILLKYEDGSNAVINYFANGSKAYAKERIEVYSGEKTFVIDNWRSVIGYGAKGFKNLKGKLDKGHKAQFELLAKAMNEGGNSLIPLESIVNTTSTTFAAIESLKKGEWVKI